MMRFCIVAHLTPRRRAAAERKPRDGGEKLRLVEQEGVVAAVGLDLDEGDVRRRGVQRMHDGAVLRASGTASREVKETTQKRVFVPRKALASTPP